MRPRPPHLEHPVISRLFLAMCVTVHLTFYNCLFHSNWISYILYRFSRVFQHFLRPVSLLICSKPVYFILIRRRAADWRAPAFIKTCRCSSHKWTTHGKILSHWINAALPSAQCTGSCTRRVWMEWILFGLLVQEFWPRGPIALDACNGIMSSLISSYHRDSMLMHPSCVYVPCSGTLKLSLRLILILT